MIRLTAALTAWLLLSLCVGTVFGQTGAPEWRRNAVCYEVFVRSYFDSDGDGTGDLRGLIQKLDYINDGNPATRADLGANCIWLMPVAQSPSYHGYDVTNYYEVERDYGTNEDFKELVSQAHRRGIRILVDLVLNHSSAEHPFFKAALVDRNSPYRDWYTWSPSVQPAPGFSQPVWHRAASREEYYYGLFWSGMPDLNLAHPPVRAEAERIARFWLEEMDVDGFRMDAVGHFFEGPGGQWKNGPGGYAWLRDYSASLKRIKPDVLTIGEVWDSMDELLKYYPDQLDTYFAFEVADALFDAVRSGNGAKLLAAVSRAQRDIPDARWGIFLRNHDQTRTLTELQGDIARNKLAVSLLLTLPGLPFVYYGEELGMTGSKSHGDPRLRTPMQWSRTRAAGFTQGMPWEPLQPDSFTANVEALENDSSSLLNLHRRLIHLRTSSPALGHGEFVPLGSTPGTIAYLRRAPGQTILVVANLGDAQLARVRVTGERSALRRGRYDIAALAPFETRIIEVK